MFVYKFKYKIYPPNSLIYFNIFHMHVLPYRIFFRTFDINISRSSITCLLYQS